MSSTKTITFICNRINRNTIVPSSKLDKTIKAIINSYISKKNNFSTNIVDYLNILRVIYYIKRLKYKNTILYKQTIGKFF